MTLAAATTSFESLSFGQGLIGTLIGALIVLLIYIYKENKASVEKRHEELKDQHKLQHNECMVLIKEVSANHESLRRRQDLMEQQQSIQRYQLDSFNKFIDAIQGRWMENFNHHKEGQ